MIDIETSKKMAKWKSDQERRALAQRSLDFYSNNHYDYIINIIKKRLDQREAKILIKYYEYENLTEALIADASLMFREPATIETKDSSFQDTLKGCMFMAIMRDVNKLVNLNYDVGVIPQMRNGMLELDIITSNLMFVEQNEMDPTKADKIYYQVGVLIDTPGKADRIDVYHYWSVEGKFKCHINFDGIIDPDSIEQLNAPDYRGEIPIVMFRNYIPKDSFFSNKRNAIVDKNEQVDLRLTALNMLEDYNLPQRVNIGIPRDKEIKVGLTFTIDIPQNDLNATLGDSKFINPNAPVKDEWELIENRMIRLAHSIGLSADSIKGAEYTSGFHYALSKQEIIQKNKEERFYYTESIKKLCRIMQLTLGKKPDKEINIDYGEVKFAEDPEVQARVRAMRVSNGTRSRIDFIMEDNPDLDREGAIERAKEIDEDNSLFGKKITIPEEEND